MPPRKKVPKLKDLCIENMARNIEAHTELFRRRGEEKEIYIPYKLFQSLFTDDLLEKISEIHLEGIWDEAKRKKFLSFIIPDGKSLLLNEHTTCLFPEFSHELGKIPEEVFSYIVSHCKKLRSLDLRCCEFGNESFYKPHLELRYLRNLDFGIFGSDRDLKRIFELCPFIREITMLICDISDSPFLSLCKHNSERKEFFFCPENGACSRAGNHLQKIHILHLKATKTGVACALQHLPQLREFNKLPVNGSPNYSQPDVFSAILLLQNAAANKGMPKITLQLASFHLNMYSTSYQLRDIAFYCPKLEIVQIDLSVITRQTFTSCSFQTLKELHLYNSTNEVLNSLEFIQFLAEHRETIQVLKISSVDLNFELIDLTCLNNMLHACCNLKQLEIEIDLLSQQSYQHTQLLPPSIDGLESVNLYVPRCTQSCVEYFSQLFCKTRNIEYLAICGPLVQILPNNVEVHGFRHLEELCLYDTDTSDLSLEKLTTANNSLKKITFSHCKNQHFPVTQVSCTTKEQIRQKNYDLEIYIF